MTKTRTPTGTSGEYLSGCGGTHSGTCTDCGACGSGEFRRDCDGLSAGSCASCLNDLQSCPKGYYRKGCSGLSIGNCESRCTYCSSVMFELTFSEDSLVSLTQYPCRCIVFLTRNNININSIECVTVSMARPEAV